MPQFTYRARNAQGALVEGVLDCADRAVAIRQIESQHCIPIRIDMVEPVKPVETKGTAPPAAQRKLRLLSSPEVATPSQSLKIPHGQLLIFTEQLAHLLQAGMTLDEGLSILKKRLKQPRVQQMTHTLHQALIDGRSFSQALSDMPRIFPPLYVNLVAAGEASGALPQILLRLVKHLMQAKELRDRVQQALIYPAFLALAGANRRRASIADAHPAAISPCDHWLLVGRRTDTDWWNYRFPRRGAHSGREDRMGPAASADPWVRTSDSPSLLRAVCAYSGDFDGKRRAFAAVTGSGD